MRTAKIILILCILLLQSWRVFGMDSRQQEAKRYYEKGKQYYKQAKYAEAKEEFQKAFSLIDSKSPRPGQKIPAVAKAASAPEYTISNEDVLSISVWQNKDLDQEAIVRPDGMISFPLVGDLPATGLTIKQLDDSLTKKLNEYIKYPDVSISVKKIGGQKVVVLGEVASPGVHLLSGQIRVLEAVGLSGGFTPSAVVSSVILIRGSPSAKKSKGIRLNLSRAIMRADISQNVVLKPQDVVYVPKKFIANVNYFVTQIIGPLYQASVAADTYQKR